MNLANYGMETIFTISPEVVNVLIVEDEQYFYQICSGLFSQLKGEDGDFVLSDRDKIISLSKSSLLIYNYLDLTVNDKKIVSKLIVSLQETIQLTLFKEIDKLSAEFANFFEKLNAESDFPLEYDETDPAQILLKAMGVKIDEGETLLERLISYVEAAHVFLKIQCFFFINLKTILTEEQLQLFYSEMRQHEISIFLIENIEKKKLGNEKVVLIDRDLCEIDL